MMGEFYDGLTGEQHIFQDYWHRTASTVVYRGPAN